MTRTWRLGLAAPLALALLVCGLYAARAAAQPAPPAGPTVCAPPTTVPSPNVGPNRNRLLDVAAQESPTPLAVATASCLAPWSLFSSTDPSGYDNTLYGITSVPSGAAWAVGAYSGPAYRTLVETWTGTDWAPVPSPNLGAGNNFLFAVAARTATDIWAVGDYYTGGPSQTLILHWDGAAWAIVPSPNRGTGDNRLVAVAAFAPDDVWAVGYAQGGSFAAPLALHWDGTAWNLVPAPPAPPGDGYFYGVAGTSASDVWAVGADREVPYQHLLLLHWDGATWTPFAPGPYGTTEALRGVVARAPNDVWAVGTAGPPNRTLVLHWDGTAWSRVASPSPGTQDNHLYGVAARTTGDVWAVGALVDGSGYQRTLVLHWDGTSWQTEPSPNASSSTNELYGVTAGAADAVWAAGHYLPDQLGVGYRTLVAGQRDLCATPVNTPWPTRTATPTATSSPTPTPSVPCAPVWQASSPPLVGALFAATVLAADDAWAVGSGDPGTLTRQSAPGAPAVADWTAGLVFRADKGRAGGVRAYPGDYAGGWNGQYGRLAVNAAHWLGPRSPCTTPTVGAGSPTATPGPPSATTTRPATTAPTATAPYIPTLTATRTACPACSYQVAATASATLVPGTLDSGNHCDDCVTNISLPFPYGLYDHSFMTAGINSNGALSFGPAGDRAAGGAGQCMPFGGSDYTIFAYATDLCTGPCFGAPCPGCGVYTSISGTAPDRIFNLEWRAIIFGSTAMVNFEVRLYEDQARFDMIYPQVTTDYVVVGVQRDVVCYTQYHCGYGLPQGLGLAFTLPACPPPTPAPATATATGVPTSSATPRPLTSATAPPIPTATGTPVAAPTQTALPASPTPSATPPIPTVTSTPFAGPTQTARPASPAPSTTPTVAGPPPPATLTAAQPTPTPAGEPTVTPCTNPFADVQPTDYFYTPVLYLACHGVLSGYADGTFRPYAHTTRAQMVKIVVLGYGKAIPTPTGTAYTFEDVPRSAPFWNVIETAAALNIVSGYTCGAAPAGPCVPPLNRLYFLPNANVTRGQLSKIDAVAAGWPLINPATPTFLDVLPGSPFYTFVETAGCHGVISGYADHTFRPRNDATRGQIAKIVYLSITTGGACVPPPPIP